MIVDFETKQLVIRLVLSFGVFMAFGIISTTALSILLNRDFDKTFTYFILGFSSFFLILFLVDIWLIVKV